jgi:hypothetical protein
MRSATGLIRAAVGDILLAPGGRKLLLGLLQETFAVATAAGFKPRPAFREFLVTFFKTDGSTVVGSPLRDIERADQEVAVVHTGDRHAQMRLKPSEPAVADQHPTRPLPAVFQPPPRRAVRSPRLVSRRRRHPEAATRALHHGHATRLIRNGRSGDGRQADAVAESRRSHSGGRMACVIA